ncbi:MAG: NAD(P)H-dependent oxidoreductase subunit E, partial [Chloroflexi bacterium]|nr:NAD(P)H-dependent oxidoreductase subunit E [Chloroflexota bacterium]
MSEIDLAELRLALQEYIPHGRTALLPALQAAQRLYGYLPEQAAEETARALGAPLADVHGVIEFYTLFYRQPVGKRIVRVCTDPACALAGGEDALQSLCRQRGIQPGETTADGALTVERSTCLGLCEHAPAALADERGVGNIASLAAEGWPSVEPGSPGSRLGGDLRVLTANCGRGRPASLEEYLSGGGYNGLKRALGMTPAAVIAEVKASGLVGRGGAAFPSGLKWEGAANAAGQPKYVVCNADESEPGTFKDRVLLEEDPQRILEGMVIAAYAIGAAQGYLFVRGEYPYAYQVMAQAAAAARQAGFLGKDILGSGFDFDVELRLGAGAYICGEETALFEAIEGKRG